MWRHSGSVALVLTTYRRALELPGARRFSASGFVARLPIAMVGLGIVLLISSETGSYALAGAFSAAFQISAAVGALVTSRWTDRVGQHRTLPVLAVGHALGLAAFVLAVQGNVVAWAQFAVVIVAGACQPAIGSMVRARWAYVADDPARLRGAFALESIVDEVIFTIGPLLTAFLAFQVALPLPIILAAVLAVAGSLVLAAQRATEPPPSDSRPSATQDEAGSPEGRSAIGLAGMPLMVIGALGLGGVFGTYEVSVVAFTQESGQPAASGIVLGLWAAGSMLGGLYFGSRNWAMALPRQVVVMTGLLSAVLVPAAFVHSVPVLALATFIAGLAVAPALIAVFSLTERLVPPRLLTEGLTWTMSGLAMGFSIGTALAGGVIDSLGTTWGFVLPSICAATSFLTALAGRHVLQRASEGRPQPLPVRTLNADPVPGPAPGGIVDDPDVTGRQGGAG